MSLQSRLGSLINAIGADIKSLDSRLDVIEAEVPTYLSDSTIDGGTPEDSSQNPIYTMPTQSQILIRQLGS